MKLYKTLFFIIVVFILLGIIALFFPQPEVSIGDVSLRFPSLESIFGKDTTETEETSAEELLIAAESTLAMDSATAARNDSLEYYKRFFSESPTRIYFPKNNVSYLFPLFEALEMADSVRMHIMHYGDSQIEGDRITGYIRNALQSKFGGSGPGLLPLVQPVSSKTVTQSVTDSVKMYYAGGMMGDRAPHKRYGAMAQMAQIDHSSPITFKARTTKAPEQLTVFAGNVDSALNIKIGKATYDFKQQREAQSVTFDIEGKRRDVTVKIQGRGDLYGIEIGSKRGVSVSNIPMRGSEGSFFVRIDADAMTQMHKTLNTRLIIMEFGGNALPAIKDSADVVKFAGYFKNQISYLKRLMPEVSILVIGPADMAVKRKGILKTTPMLPYLVEKMRENTLEAGGAFWNMFEVMGGEGSMVIWAKHRPAWAAPDYIHFTRKGAERIAEVLNETLQTYYKYWKFTKEANEDIALE